MLLTTTAVANAKSSARQYAGYNGAGGVGSLSVLDADISVGFTGSDGSFTAYSSGGTYPNTV